MPTMRRCDFCEIVAGTAPAKIEHEWPDALAIHTIRPKAPGHLLVIPKVHIQDASEDPYIAGRVMKRAAEIAKPPCHLNTNLGGAAAQTVFHMHIHVIPRKANQEVKISWFKPWEEHPLDRRCEEKKSSEKLGISSSWELEIMSRRISMKTDVSLTKIISGLFGQQKS
jgi:histidine triad (HIT) family protein